MPAKAFSYIRFSSVKQADGDSLRRQRDARDAYCQRKGLVLDESLSLSDLGVSAWKGDNAATGGLAVFLDLCRKGMIPKGSCLIVEHLDRLTRQHVRKALTLFFEILDAGVTIVTLQPEREYTPEASNDPLSLIEPLFLFANANEKSETLSRRLRDAWAEKRRQRKPLTRWTPAWIRMKDDRSGFELIPERAKIVRAIVQLALDGYGDLRLVRKLNDDKWPVISDHKHWTNAYVSKILKSPALIGWYEPGIEVEGKRVLTGELWPDYFPALITMEEWYRLRAARKSRTFQRGPVGNEVANLFTGVLFNVRDRQAYHRIVKNHARLISASYRNGLSDGDTLSFPYEPLEHGFLYAFAHDLKLQDLFAERAKPSEDVLANLVAELADVEHRIGAVREKVKTDPNITVFLDLLAELDQKKKSLTANIEEERTRQVETGREADVLNDLQALAKMWMGDCPDRADLRTRLKARLRQLVAEMWMIVYGVKRSKFKTAHVQIFFKAGGSKSLFITAETTKPITVELVERSTTGIAIEPHQDFRLYNHDEKGKPVKRYVDFMEKVHFSFAEAQQDARRSQSSGSQVMGSKYRKTVRSDTANA